MSPDGSASPTVVQLTSMSAGLAAVTARLRARAASALRPLGGAVPDRTLAPRRPRAAPRPPRARCPRRRAPAPCGPPRVEGSAAISPGASVLSAAIRAVARTSACWRRRSRRAAGVAVVGQGQRRLLVRDRHVGAGEPGAGQRPHGLGERLGRHRQPAGSASPSGRARRSAALCIAGERLWRDGPAEDAAAPLSSCCAGSLPPRASRARL